MADLASLSTQQTPPLSVPLRFFLTAPLFMGLAGLLLMVMEPASLESRWNGQVLALVHLWVLGMMLMVMLGAVQQVIPVLVGTPLAHPGPVSLWSHLLLVPGILLLVAAFLWNLTWAYPLAALLLLAAVLLVVSASWLAMRRAASVHATVWGIRLAMLTLKLTVLLGAWLALGHGGEVMLRRDWTDLHLAGGLVGWSVLLVSAVAWQVVPMFQITPRYPRWLMRPFAPALFLLLLLWMLGRWLPGPGWMELIGAAGVSLALTLFALATLRLQQQRRRKVPDATLDLWRLSMASLLAAVVFWWLGQAGMEVPVLLPGILLAAGFVGSAILGMLYKIVPFLVWLHLTNRAQASGRLPRGIPNMKQVIPSSRSRLLFRLYLVWVPLVAAVPFRPEWLARPAGGLLLLIATLLGFHLMEAARLHKRRLQQIDRGE